jgi:DNA-binding response OmpR family regulator
MSPDVMSSSAAPRPDEQTVLVFSDDPAFRERVRLAVGRRPAPDVGRVNYLEAATGAEVIAAVDAGGVDLIVLDAEAQPTGGMGICRQLKNEIEDCPLICAVLARSDDRWLATWSQADATLTHPLDPLRAAEVVAGLLRRRAGVLAARP